MNIFKNYLYKEEDDETVICYQEEVDETVEQLVHLYNVGGWSKIKIIIFNCKNIYYFYTSLQIYYQFDVYCLKFLEGYLL